MEVRSETYIRINTLYISSINSKSVELTYIYTLCLCVCTNACVRKYAQTYLFYFKVWGENTRESEIVHCLKSRYVTDVCVYLYIVGK